MYSQSDVILNMGCLLRLVIHDITVIDYIIVFIHFINMFIMSLIKQLLITSFYFSIWLQITHVMTLSTKSVWNISKLE